MEKLTIQAIIDAFASQSGITKKSAEAIARTFFEMIVEGLNADGVVKINGFGTFKVVNVAERESVNVNNGERIVIEGYKKVTFVPAEAAANSPKVADAPKKTAAPKAPKAETKTENKEEVVAVVESVYAASAAKPRVNDFSAIDDIISTPESVKEAQKTASRTDAAPEPVKAAAVATPAAVEKPLQQPASTKVEPKKTPWKLIAGIIILLLLIGLAFLLLSKNEGKEDVIEQQPVAVEVEETAQEEVKDTVQQKTYVMQPGDYLAKISRDIYGTKDSVPSIIRLNQFPDPDNIPVGSTILLP